MRTWRRLLVSQAPAGDLEALSEAPAAVREFDLLTGDTVHDLRGLRHLPDGLEELRLAAVWKGRPSLAPLARFQALRRVALDARSGPLRDVDVLGRLPDLRVLWLARFKGLDLTPLLRLPALQALELSFGSRTSDLSGLAEIPTLRFLDVNWSRRPDALDGLGAVRSLEYLSVSACSQVTALPDLARLERLRFVIIESQKRLTDISGSRLLRTWSRCCSSTCRRPPRDGSHPSWATRPCSGSAWAPAAIEATRSRRTRTDFPRWTCPGIRCYPPDESRTQRRSAGKSRYEPAESTVFCTTAKPPLASAYAEDEAGGTVLL